MRDKAHRYELTVRWTGNLGLGTSAYRAYARDHEIVAAGKPVLVGSADPAFRGHASRYNPEELLVAALSACHMLAYLHLCADNGVVVKAYTDDAEGTMVETPGGGGRFTEVVLAPLVTVASAAQEELAIDLHRKAHDLCFIASSVNFAVVCHPRVEVAAVA